jgi:haloalkane dehalogenase
MRQRPDWFDDALVPYPPNWVTLDGHQLHYLDVGSGPVLLMVHGNPTWSFLYRRMIGALSDRFRCIALDLPGFGLSIARPGYDFTAEQQSGVVAAFVTTLDLRGVTPIVQDWGGPVGLGAAVADPDRYERLIIGNTWAWPSNLWTRGFSQVMGGRLTGELMSQRLNMFVGRMIPGMMRRRTLSPAELAMYAGPFPTPESRAPARIFAREIRTAAPFLGRLERQLPRILDRPALLFWADKDIAFHSPVRRQWQERLTQRTDHTLAGAGHFWPDDAGEEAAARIRAWFDFPN